MRDARIARGGCAAPGGDGGVVGVLHLAEDLRLAEHHRVEASPRRGRRGARPPRPPSRRARARDRRRCDAPMCSRERLADGARAHARGRPRCLPFGRAMTSTRLHVERNITSSSSGRAASRARTCSSAVAVAREALAHVDRRGAEREADDDDHDGGSAPTAARSSARRGSRLRSCDREAPHEVDDEDDDREPEAGDRAVRGAPATPAAPARRRSTPAMSGHVT